eukprot:gene10789-10946_t
MTVYRFDTRTCAIASSCTGDKGNISGKSAYKAAISAGVDCIEIDVSLTADGALVAVHDRDLPELMATSSPVKVQKHTLARLQTFSWASGEVVLTAEEALAVTAPHVKLVILDVKTATRNWVDESSAESQEAVMVRILLQLLQDNQYSNILIWAKSDEVARLTAPDQQAGYTVMLSPGTEYEQPLRMEEAEVAAVYHKMLNETLMDAFRAGKKSVYAWTADQPDELKHLLDLAVDGVVTNDPKLLLQAVQTRLAMCQQ